MRRDHKLLREISRWRGTSVETPVPSRVGRVAGRWTRITNDAVAPAKRAGRPILCVLRQNLTDIIRHIARDGQHLSNRAQPVESPFLEFNQRMLDIPRTSIRQTEVRCLTLGHQFLIFFDSISRLNLIENYCCVSRVRYNRVKLKFHIVAND